MESTSSEGCLTASDVIEYLFCPRFIYFIYVLSIPQREGRRFKVLKGRELHKKRGKSNTAYLRKELGVARKESSVYLSSPKLRIRGIVDEVLFLEDGTAAPLDFKFTRFRNFLFKTHRIQSALYGLLIQERFKVPVMRGYVCYIRGGSTLKEVEFTEKLQGDAIEIVNSIFTIIQTGTYPKPTRSRAKCHDCCYNRICEK